MTNYAGKKTFSKIFRESLLAYTFDFGGLVAGILIATQLHIFQLSPWIIAIYPAVLSAKGVIMGLFSGRLSTALHLGTIHPRFFGNTRTFHRLFQAIVVASLAASITMSATSIVLGSFLWGISTADFGDILIVVVSTMTLGLTTSLITVVVAFVTFKKGLDPDVLVYPMMSTIADIGITTCYVLVLNLFFLIGSFGRYVSLLLALPLPLLMVYILPRNIRDKEFTKTIKEFLITLVFVAVIVNITGTILNRISTVVEGRKEIYTVYPALIDTIGDVGSVVGSTATTKLALGLLDPSFKSMRNHTTQIFGAWLASALVFVMLSAMSLLLNGIFDLRFFLVFSLHLLAANLIAVSAVILVSYAVSILTFKKGLDPDNFVIPIESSLADSLMSIALLIVLVLSS